MEKKTGASSLSSMRIRTCFRPKKNSPSYLKKLIEVPSKGLSQAALEVLAIVSYKQPITRAEIEEIRGVKSERIFRAWSQKRYCAKSDGRMVRAGRFYTVQQPTFLEQFGLKTLEELPPLPENAEEDVLQEEADLFFENFNQTFEDIK